MRQVKSLFSSPGKMIGEQYKIKGVAQAEVLHHKKRLVNVHGTEPANKKDSLMHFVKTVSI